LFWWSSVRSMTNLEDLLLEEWFLSSLSSFEESLSEFLSFFELESVEVDLCLCLPGCEEDKVEESAEFEDLFSVGFFEDFFLDL
jgi:hypothetical protein